MPSIGDYAQIVTLLLSESGKYLGLLAVCVVAIRLWRRVSQISGSNRSQTLALAVVASAVGAMLGYASLSHSLARMYRNYGMRAFNRGNVPAALSLFRSAQNCWKTADAAGAEGVCLLLLDQPGEGWRRIEWAGARRNGSYSPFEIYYSGVYHLYHGQPEKAVPMLRLSAAYPEYTWRANKLMAVAFLDQGRNDEAARLMEPFSDLEVKDCDQAYIFASLKLAQKKPSEALALLDRFPNEQLNDFWRARFERLRVKTQSVASS
jgi:hypothetical protein